MVLTLPSGTSTKRCLGLWALLLGSEFTEPRRCNLSGIIRSNADGDDSEMGEASVSTRSGGCDVSILGAPAVELEVNPC
jgi:hypothetical protein